MKKAAGKKWLCRIMGIAAAVTVSYSAAPTAVLFAEEVQLVAEADTGVYTVDPDWVLTDSMSAEEKFVYKMSGSEKEEETSTITCSYIDTNYSVMEYEQLREMLTNNLLYGKVDAEISTSAGYTDAKDCLYVLTADDAEEDFREIYYYVVGDHRCFLVEVKEYRAEAEAKKAEGKDTPAEAGEKTAQKFTWNA